MHKGALAGIGGFGKDHLDMLAALQAEGAVKLCAVCEANPAALAVESDLLRSLGARIYTDYNEMFKSEKGLDFAAISTPIHLHKPMALAAMNAGLNVLLEKPPVVTLPDLVEILAAERNNGVMCAVDFLMSTGSAFGLLKDKIRSGALGRISAITAVGIGNRTDSYYSRASWAGKWRIGGEWVRDGVMNNVHPHILNNTVVLARQCRPDLKISSVAAELYRSHRIETEDTACVKAETAGGPTIYFYATLCHTKDTTPYIKVESDKATAVWTYDNALTIGYADGRTDRTPPSEVNALRNIYTNFLSCLKSSDRRSLFSSLSDAHEFLQITEGAYAANDTITDISPEYIESYTDDTGAVTPLIKNAFEIVTEAAERKVMYSSLPKAGWARK